MEAFGCLTDGVAYHDQSDSLWVVNYIASTISWAAVGLTCGITSKFPDPSPITLAIALRAPVSVTIHFRIPFWAVGANTLLINGTSVPGLALVPGDFATVTRQWSDGDVVTIDLPCSLYYEVIPDRVEYVGVKYGPHVLVACGPANAIYNGSAKQLLTALRPAQLPCQFTATLMGQLRPVEVTYKPIADVVNEWYNGYTIVKVPPTMHIIDAVDVAVDESEKVHSFVGVNSGTGVFGSYNYRDAVNNGSITYTLGVSAMRQIYFPLVYWGEDTGTTTAVRPHDLQMMRANGTWTVVATQSLDREAPGQFTLLCIPPMVLTHGQTKLTSRLQGKGTFTKPGTVGGIFDSVQTCRLEEAKETELWRLVEA